jgi:hypothetical protein
VPARHHGLGVPLPDPLLLQPRARQQEQEEVIARATARTTDLRAVVHLNGGSWLDRTWAMGRKQALPKEAKKTYVVNY